MNGHPLRTATYRDQTAAIAIFAPTFQCSKCAEYKLVQGRKLIRKDGNRMIWQCKCCAKVAV